jgi:hypothetical protein
MDTVGGGRARVIGGSDGDGSGRVVPIEIQLVDAAVPPDFVLLAGKDRRGEGLGRGQSPALKPGKPG